LNFINSVVIKLYNNTFEYLLLVSELKLVWDIRKFKDPVHVWENLEQDISGLSFCTDPNESMVVSMGSSENNQTNLQVAIQTLNCVY
jgi:hypothetical protein